VPLEEVAAIEQEQKGRCVICQEELPLCIDHDHETGKVRGLLCRLCNAGIGMLRESPEVLRRAIAYLESR